jgi:hypothetical protein
MRSPGANVTWWKLVIGAVGRQDFWSDTGGLDAVDISEAETGEGGGQRHGVSAVGA